VVSALRAAPHLRPRLPPPAGGARTRVASKKRPKVFGCVKPLRPQHRADGSLSSTAIEGRDPGASAIPISRSVGAAGPAARRTSTCWAGHGALAFPIAMGRLADRAAQVPRRHSRWRATGLVLMPARLPRHHFPLHCWRRRNEPHAHRDGPRHLPPQIPAASRSPTAGHQGPRNS